MLSRSMPLLAFPSRTTRCRAMPDIALPIHALPRYAQVVFVIIKKIRALPIHAMRRPAKPTIAMPCHAPH